MKLNGSIVAQYSVRLKRPVFIVFQFHEHGVLIQGAMDNFDHEENTKSGIGGSHDTILMLFQNTANEIIDKPKEISTKPLAEFEKKALDRVLDCQKLVRAAKYGVVARFLLPLVPSAPPGTRELEISMNADFISWVIAGSATKKHIPDFSSCENPSIPSFTATNSLLYYKKYPLTRIAFTPITPVQLLNVILSTPA